MSFSLAAMMSADPRLDRASAAISSALRLASGAAKASSAAAARAPSPSGHHHA
jgi:hypothetical protein